MMLDEDKQFDYSEKDLSMDEILSSIRDIINEDQGLKVDHLRTFEEDSDTNPAKARILDDLPQFNRDDELTIPDVIEETRHHKSTPIYSFHKEIYPDEDFYLQKTNEISLKQQVNDSFDQDVFDRDASKREEKISKALRNIVKAYDDQRKEHSVYEKKSIHKEQQSLPINRFSDTLQIMMEKMIAAYAEKWINKHLPGIIELAILKELEKAVNEIKF